MASARVADDGSSSGDGARPPRLACVPSSVAGGGGLRHRAARASGARQRDDEARQAPRRLLQRQHDAAPAVAVERPRNAAAGPRGAREGHAALGRGWRGRRRAGRGGGRGVPTCCIRPHRGVSVRRGSACRSLRSSRAGRDDDEPPWRPPARCRRDGGSSSVCPGVRWTRTPSSREEEEAEAEEDDVVPVPAADGGRLSLGRPGAGWMAKPPIDARATAGEVSDDERWVDAMGSRARRGAVWVGVSYPLRRETRACLIGRRFRRLGFVGSPCSSCPAPAACFRGSSILRPAFSSSFISCGIVGL